jgi:hypothetical protein
MARAGILLHTHNVVLISGEEFTSRVTHLKIPNAFGQDSNDLIDRHMTRQEKDDEVGGKDLGVFTTRKRL